MRRPDLTVLAIPAFVGAMAAEVLWQRRNPAPPGTTRAGDYELADTIASLTMGVGSLVAPFVSARLLDPVTPGRGRYAKVLMGGRGRGLGRHHRRRRAASAPRAGRPPGCRRAAGRGPARATHRPGCRAAPARRAARPAASRGATAVAAVASTALTVATTWSAQTSGTRLFAVTKRDLGTGAGGQRRRDPGLGRHLLLEPPVQPREPLAVGDARRAPQQRALQPVDGAAPAGGRGADDERALRPARAGRGAAERHRERPGAQPDLPVLDPHRGGEVDRLARERAQHARRTTGCTTASTASTSTATTAAS